MMRSIHLFLSLSVLLALSSCNPQEGSSTTPAPTGTSAGTQPGTADTTTASGDTAAKAEPALAKGTDAASAAPVSATSQLSADPSKAAPAAGAPVSPEIAKALDSSFTVENLKTLLGTLKNDQIQSLADRLAAVLQGENGIVQSLKSQIDKLGVLGGEKVAQLKDQLKVADEKVGLLRGKLQTVVDALKEKGLDISKYLESLKAQ